MRNTLAISGLVFLLSLPNATLSKAIDKRGAGAMGGLDLFGDGGSAPVAAPASDRKPAASSGTSRNPAPKGVPSGDLGGLFDLPPVQSMGGGTSSASAPSKPRPSSKPKPAASASGGMGGLFDLPDIQGVGAGQGTRASAPQGRVPILPPMSQGTEAGKQAAMILHQHGMIEHAMDHPDMHFVLSNSDHPQQELHVTGNGKSVRFAHKYSDADILKPLNSMGVQFAIGDDGQLRHEMPGGANSLDHQTRAFRNINAMATHFGNRGASSVNSSMPDPEFENKHPRGQGGKFTNKPGGAVESQQGTQDDGSTTNQLDALGTNVPGEPSGEQADTLSEDGSGRKPGEVPQEQGEASGGRSGDDGAGGSERDARSERGDSSVHPDTGRGGVPGSSASAGQLDSEPDLEMGERDVALSIQQGPRKRGVDYHITAQDNLGVGGDRTKYRDNIAAIRLLKQLQAEGRDATPEEQSVLVRYTGWGWSGNGLFAEANKMHDLYEGRYSWHKPNDWYDQYQELKGLLTEEEFKAANESITNAHYTSDDVCEAMWEVARHLGFTGGRAIEPGCGIGNFVGTMPRDIWQETAVTGVEMDPITAQIAQQLYQSAHIVNAPYQDTKLADNFFDLGLGNVPFLENINISDPEFQKLSDRPMARHLHNFFFGKTLNKVRQDGVMMMISTNGTMDSRTSSNARQWLDDRAEFLGAIRLPNDAFKENAKTEVVTDILFFRKRAEGEEKHGQEYNWIESVEHTDPHTGKKFWVNPYFIEHPDMVMGKMFVEPHGMYAKDTMTVDSDGRDLKQSIIEAAKSALPENILHREPGFDSIRDLMGNNGVMDDAPLPGSYVLRNNKVHQWTGSEYKELDYKPTANGQESKDIKRIRAMIPMKKSARDLLAMMADPEATDSEIQAEQLKLKASFHAFVKEYGAFHSPNNVSKLHQDPDLALMLAMEDYDEKTGAAKPGAFLVERTVVPLQPVTKVDDAFAALSHSLAEKGKIDPDHMQSLMPGRTAANILGELEEQGHVFHNPIGGYEHKDAYLSGDVRAKLKAAEAAATLEPRYDRNVEALRAVIPTDLMAHEIVPNLGAGWIPPSDVEEFVNSEILQVPLHRRDREGSSVRYLAQTGDWVVTPGKNHSEGNRTRVMYGTDQKKAIELVAHALSFKPVVITYKDADGVKHNDKEGMRDAQKKVEAIRAAFKKWVFTDPERTDRLVKLYNETQNNFVEQKFDGQFLSLPGLSEVARLGLNDHIKDCVWRSLQQKNTLHAVAVGGGKSWIKIISAMEGKRLGLFQKPVITVPNHVVPQMAAQFKELYPNANVLMVTKKDFTVEGRRLLMAKMATGKWDAIVIAHSQFTRIPVTSETMNQHYQKLFDQIDAAFYAALEEELGEGAGHALGISPDDDPEELKKKLRKAPTAKAIAKSKTRWKEMLKKKGNAASQMADGFIPFEHLGVDQILVDEAHDFKNLPLVTTLGRMKGIPGAGAGSIRAFDLLMKARYVQNKRNGAGLIFATGTPIANSIAELYVHSHFLAPEVLESQGVNNFDSWIKNYSEPETTSEVTASGQTREVTRFAKFSNVPEMSRQFRQFANVLNREDLPSLKTPKVNRIPVTCEQDDHQDAIARELFERADAISRGKPQQVYSKAKGEFIDDNMLRVCSDGRKNTLDARLYNTKAAFNHNGKIAKCVDNMFKEWEAGHESEHVPGGKLTQVAFMDLGTPKASDKTGDEASDDPEEEHDPAAAVTAWAQKQSGTVRHFASAAADWLIGGQQGDVPRGVDFGVEPEHEERIWDDLNKQWEGDDADDVAAQSLYAEMKQRLIDKGIPADQIAFIHDAKNEKQKLELSEKVKSGEVRILLGSTAKMGTGLNVQNRLKALHHLDCPWRPCDLEQREGRIIRQGNKNPEVNIYTYLGTTKGGVKLDEQGKMLEPTAEEVAPLVHTLAGASDEQIHKLALEHADDLQKMYPNRLVPGQAGFGEQLERFHRVAAASLHHHYKRQLGMLQSQLAAGQNIPGAEDLLRRALPGTSGMAKMRHEKKFGVENALARHKTSGMEGEAVPFTPEELDAAATAPMPNSARQAESTPTMDAFFWQLIQRKQHCATQVMRGDASMRTIDDVSDDTPDAATYKAYASGSPLEQEKNELERELTKLEMDHASHARNAGELKQRLAMLPGQIERTSQSIEKLNGAIAHRDKMGHLKDGAGFHAEIGGNTFTNRDDAAAALMNELNAMNYDHDDIKAQETATAGRKIGSLFGFDLGIKRILGKRNIIMTPSHEAAKRGEAHAIIEDPSQTAVGTVEKLRGVLKRLEVNRDAMERGNEKAKGDLEEMKNMSTEFPHLGRMEEIRKRIGEIDAQRLGVTPVMKATDFWEIDGADWLVKAAGGRLNLPTIRQFSVLPELPEILSLPGDADSLESWAMKALDSRGDYTTGNPSRPRMNSTPSVGSYRSSAGGTSAPWLSSYKHRKLTSLGLVPHGQNPDPVKDSAHAGSVGYVEPHHPDSHGFQLWLHKDGSASTHFAKLEYAEVHNHHKSLSDALDLHDAVSAAPWDDNASQKIGAYRRELNRQKDRDNAPAATANDIWHGKHKARRLGLSEDRIDAIPERHLVRFANSSDFSFGPDVLHNKRQHLIKARNSATSYGHRNAVNRELRDHENDMQMLGLIAPEDRTKGLTGEISRHRYSSRKQHEKLIADGWSHSQRGGYSTYTKGNHVLDFQHNTVGTPWSSSLSDQHGYFAPKTKTAHQSVKHLSNAHEWTYED